jgi:hypothetical protein
VSILDGLNERIARHRNRDFLNAAMAAGALAAQADGTVTLSERYRIDGILARLERLRIYDPHKVAQIRSGSKSGWVSKATRPKWWQSGHPRHDAVRGCEHERGGRVIAGRCNTPRPLAIGFDKPVRTDSSSCFASMPNSGLTVRRFDGPP